MMFSPSTLVGLTQEQPRALPFRLLLLTYTATLHIAGISGSDVELSGQRSSSNRAVCAPPRTSV